MYGVTIFVRLVIVIGDFIQIVELAQVPKFDRFFTIVLENDDYWKAMDNSYLATTLRNKGRLLTNMHSVGHPSQPNYFAMISGSTQGVNDDYKSSLAINVPTIVDVLEAKGITWKAYNEKYPGGCSPVGYAGKRCYYARKHNPFISFPSISNNAARCSNIVNRTQFLHNLASNHVPQYVFYVPDTCNDGHDTGIYYSANWLRGFLEPLLLHPHLNNTAFFIVFDESSQWSSSTQIYGLLVGGGYAAGSSDDTYYDHYSQMATLEARWSTGNIGQGDATAFPFTQ